MKNVGVIGDERDGEDAAQRSDECQLRDERRVPAVFQAEHGAEAGYRHRNHHGVDIVHHIAHTAYLEEEVEAQRNHYQPPPAARYGARRLY